MSSTVLWYASRATGLVALVLLSATMVLGVLTATRVSGRWWPGFATQELHLRLSLTSLVFLAAHILTAVLDAYVHIGFVAVVVPFTSGYKPLWIGMGAIAVDLLLAVAVSSLIRHRIPARVWRGLHWLVYASWPVAVLHGFAMGTDVRLRWVLWLAVGCIVAVAGALWWRLARLASARRRLAGLRAVRERPRGVPLKHLTNR